MEQSHVTGNVHRVFKLVKHITKKAAPPPSNLTSDKNGKLLTSPDDVAAVWFKFLAAKFAETKAEATRHVKKPLDKLPSIRTADDTLTRDEFDKAVNRMSNAKAVGPCGVPIEAYQ